jgi:formylglycine-generating enzyme required for sulfatase activity
MICLNTSCENHRKDLGNHKFCPECGQKTASPEPQTLTCLSASCSNQGRNLGSMKFCPECGSVTMPPDQWHGNRGSVYSGAVGSQFEVSLSAQVRQVFCFIPSGRFIMGSPADEEGRFDVEQQVEVTLTRPFWLAKTVVTQSQWEAVMGSNPSEFRGAEMPVENVSWEDAQSYIAKLNEKRVLPEGWKFALPTEAQWEYACRAGEKGPYSGGALDEVAWYCDNSGGRTHEVAQKKPNAWGLHDMHGNVWEWCADWLEDAPLMGGIDPAGPSSGDYRVFRGGSWSFDASYCRAARRNGDRPGLRLYLLGFRPALVPSR